MYSFRTASFLSATDTAAGFVRIAPSRSRLVRSEPTVGFTISTDRQFAEIIVATDPELFRSEAASRRTTANFFASREHGLLKGPGQLMYMLPAAFVAAAVEQTPRPSKLYYLAVAYSSERASDPLYSVPLEAADGIPYIEIAPDIHLRSISAALGVAVERLSRPTARREPQPVALAAAPDAPRVIWRQETTGTLQPPRLNGHSQIASLAADAAPWSEPVATRSSDAPEEFGTPEAGDDFVYEDGYEAPSHRAAETALGSSFPAGASEPSDLVDDEDEDAREPGSRYGDEADVGASAAEAAPASPSPAALDQVLDVVVKARRGALYTLARPTDHDGLAFGATQATQRSGDLGRLLARMHAADPASFERVFGPEAPALLSTANAASESARLAPVAGRPLTDGQWRERFAVAGQQPAFLEVQRSFARETLLEPVVAVARDLGLASPRGVAVLAAVCIARGLSAGLRWALAGIGPGTSPAQLQAALRALGDADVAAFQRRNDLPVTSELDPRTHGRLVAALRALAAGSPVPVLSPAQMLETLVRQAAEQPFRHKLESLARDPGLDDDSTI